VFDDPAEVVGHPRNSAVPLEIQFTASDPEGQPLTFSQTGAPSWMTVDVSAGDIRLTGTPPANFTGPVTITVSATELSAPNQTTSHTFDFYVETFEESPLKGQLVITEVRYAETALDGSFASVDQYDEFVEIQNVGNTPIDLTDFSISEHNFRTQNGEGNVSIPYQIDYRDRSNPRRDSELQSGERAIVWIWNPREWGGTIDTGAALHFVANYSANADNFFSILDNDGDDIWLLDDQERVIDYVAWGSRAMGSLVIDSAAPSHELWDTTDDGHLLGTDPGQSISLAIPLTTGAADIKDPTGYTNPRCWEQTGSNTASCAEAVPPTVATDGGGDVSSAGEENL